MLRNHSDARSLVGGHRRQWGLKSTTPKAEMTIRLDCFRHCDGLLLFCLMFCRRSLSDCFRVSKASQTSPERPSESVIFGIASTS